MKRALFILFLFISLQAYSQEHMKFMGIPINGTTPTFVKKLEAKGFVVNKEEKNCVILNGLFTDEKATVYVFHSAITNKVYLVDVFFEKKDTWYELEKQYQEYKSLLIKKYGTPDSHYEEFNEPYYEDHKYMELNAVREGKCVYATDFTPKTGLITVEIAKSQQIEVSYQDKANANIMRKERNKEKIDDL